ncbi:hypothetical protein M988_2426 [Hafnia paralvei ATCC 29927]|uniref:hypothetical protein n=1 Tax=Hafnia paralvei TaxID=546367 RepID=UPI0007E4A5B9|nr:hypothetical protein [Hafnia paralvei]OAT40220.1 hypothetical protein M988_2426 [Hafnia paralvei ATCC 29927]
MERNNTTQTGTDNTLAFQNAINALANMPDIRNGQVRQLYIPNGNYRIKNIIVPDSYGFMIEFKGDGFINTRLYCYPDSPTTTPCIEINIEYVSFDSIEVLASLKRNASLSDRSATLVEVKLPDGRADCDIKLMPTSSFGGAETLFRVYGRGFHCNGAVMFFSGTFLEIACDTRTWTTGGNQSTTGMRNYLINNRFDTVGVMVKITGSGYQKDHINDLIISGNDIYQMDRLILGADATLQHSIISSNSSVGSFAYNVIELNALLTLQYLQIDGLNSIIEFRLHLLIAIICMAWFHVPAVLKK